MKNKTTLIIVVTVITLLAIGYVTAQSPYFDNANINNIRAIQKGLYNDVEFSIDNDSYMPYLIDVNYFINVSGSPTGTFTTYQFRETIPVELNINSLNTVNKTIRNAIKDRAKDTWNYTLPDSKVLIMPLVKGNEFN